MSVFKKTRKFFFSHLYLILFAIARRLVGSLFVLLFAYLGRNKATLFLIDSKETIFAGYPALYDKSYAYFSPLLSSRFSSLRHFRIQYQDWMGERRNYKEALSLTDQEATIVLEFYKGRFSSTRIYLILSVLIELGIYFLTSFLISILLRRKRKVKGGLARFILRHALHSGISALRVGGLSYLLNQFPLIGGLSSLILFLFRLWFSLFSAYLLQGEKTVSYKDVRKWSNASGLYGADFILGLISALLLSLVTSFNQGSYILTLLSSSFYRYSENCLTYSTEGYVSSMRENVRKKVLE